MRMLSRFALRIALAGTLALAGHAAHALPPDQIFERAAAISWQLRSLGANEQLLATATGIAVAPDKVLTSCRALARAQQVQLRRGNQIFDAKLESPDTERDLCLLAAPGLAARALAPGSSRELKPGQRLYVIGYGVGNAVSIGEGLVSVVHDPGTGQERIQTTVPAASGLLGAGVYDAEARLVGIVTASPKEAPATVFAVPADWVAEVAARGAAALAARAKPVAAAPAAASADGRPRPGSTWNYAFQDRVYSRRSTEFTVQALGTEGDVVQESISVKGTPAVRRVVQWRDPVILARQVDGNTTIFEAPPYLLAANGGKAPAMLDGVTGYTHGESILPRWLYRASVEDWEQVSVPAGTYRALRVVLSGIRERTAMTGNVLFVGRFELTAWYAPEVRRYVMLEHKAWSGGFGGQGQLANHDVVELIGYSKAP